MAASTQVRKPTALTPGLLAWLALLGLFLVIGLVSAIRCLRVAWCSPI